MGFIDVAVLRCSSKLKSLWVYGPPGASPPDANDPRKTDIHEQLRLLLVRKQPNKLDCAFVPAFDETNFFGTGELFVARHPLYGIAKRSCGERGDFDRVVTLDALLATQLQAETWIVAGFRNSSVKAEELLGAHQDFLLVEQSGRQTCLPQYCPGRNTQFFEPSRERTGNSESLRHGLTDRNHLCDYSFSALEKISFAIVMALTALGQPE